MPVVHRIEISGPSGREVAVIWNVEASVGRPHGTNRSMDAMLVQFLLFDGEFCDQGDIDGSWGPRSQSFLKEFEKTFSGPTSTPIECLGVKQDGIVDRMRPGQKSGSISGLEYKMNLLNRMYVKKRKKSPTAQASGVEVTDITMDIMVNDPNMPKVLQTELKKQRDAAGL
jgi:hypothetical protein